MYVTDVAHPRSREGLYPARFPRLWNSQLLEFRINCVFRMKRFELQHGQQSNRKTLVSKKFCSFQYLSNVAVVDETGVLWQWISRHRGYSFFPKTKTIDPRFAKLAVATLPSRARPLTTLGACVATRCHVTSLLLVLHRYPSIVTAASKAVVDYRVRYFFHWNNRPHLIHWLVTPRSTSWESVACVHVQHKALDRLIPHHP